MALAERIIAALRASQGGHGTCPNIFNAVNHDGSPAATKDGFEKTCQQLHDEGRVTYRPIRNPIQPMGTLDLSAKERQHWILEILAKSGQSDPVELESVRQEYGYAAAVFMDDCRSLSDEHLVALVGEFKIVGKTIVGTGKITSQGVEMLRKESLTRLGL